MANAKKQIIPITPAMMRKTVKLTAKFVNFSFIVFVATGAIFRFDSKSDEGWVNTILFALCTIFIILLTL